MSNKTLHLSFSDLDQPDISEDELFVISEDLSDEYNWFTRFSELKISQKNMFSYDLFWPHLVLGSRGNLLMYAMLYSNLSERIDSDNISKIVSHDLKKGYRLVTEDLAAEHNIAVEHKQQSRDSLLSTSKLLFRSSVIFLIFDQIFSIIKNRLFSSDYLSQSQPLFFPYPGRYKSMLPVIREMEHPSNIVVTPLTISWRLLNPVSDWPEEHKTKTLSEFSDTSTIKMELVELFKLQKKLLTDDLELSQKLNDKLRYKYDVQLSRTIEYVCQDILHRDIRLILSLYLIDNAVEQTEPTSVIVGGMNPRDRYMLKVGDAGDADLFYIPHSIVYHNEIVPQIAETTHFVSGEADERVLENQYSKNILPDIQPLGRPYIDNLFESKNSRSKKDESQKIILGTQPYPNWIRKRFIKEIMQVISEIDYNEKVLIKVHPSESVGYYENIIQANSFRFDVQVRKGDIVSHITHATTLITINSNVGIESILAGAFCISYNPFEPFTLPSSYIDGEHVPYTTTPIELRDHLEMVIGEETTANEKQCQYIKQLFNIGDSDIQLSMVLSN